MSTATEREVSLTNIGPHESLKLQATPGKITVLRGPNGSGKTQVLDAVDAVQRGGKSLSSRDGTVGGSCDFGGVTIKVARNGANRRSGDLLVESLEDRLSLATFVDPALKDSHAADDSRIRSLLLIAGVQPDASRYYDLVGGKEQFEALMPSEAIEEKDAIKQAARVKSAFEAAARGEESKVATLKKRHGELLATCEGIDTSAPSDKSVLSAALETAIATHADIAARRKSGLELLGTAKVSRENLEEAKSKWSGPTITEAQAANEAAGKEVHAANEARRVAEAALQDAKNRQDIASEKMTKAMADLRAAENHASTLSSWQSDVEAAEAVKVPSETELELSAKIVEDAKQADHNGVRIRDAIAAKAQADELGTQIKTLSKTAADLRKAAQGTQDVLSKLVGELGVPLSVDADYRLLAKHAKRGKCYFSELSMGERWKLGLDIVLGRADGPALLVIPQEAWESLDAKNRKGIADRIDGTEVSILTAEATQDAESAGIEVGTYE